MTGTRWKVMQLLTTVDAIRHSYELGLVLRLVDLLALYVSLRSRVRRGGRYGNGRSGNGELE